MTNLKENQMQNCIDSYNLLQYLLKTIPKYLNNKINLNLQNNTITIYSSIDNFSNLMLFLKNY